MTKQITVRYHGSDTTQRLHAKGAELDGAAWLTLNMAIADNLRVYVDIGDQAVKEMLARTALVALVSLQKAGYLEVPKP